MTIRIVMDAHGGDVIWSEVGGKAVGLPTENLFFRALDGHCFNIAPAGLPQRLRPHEPEMIEFWLREKGAKIEPNIFAGESPPETDTTDEKD